MPWILFLGVFFVIFQRKIIMDIELLLWLPIVLLTLASIIKIFNKNKGNRKPWIRIEEIKENE